MTATNPSTRLFETDVFGDGGTIADKLPAFYRYYKVHQKKEFRVVADPAEDVKNFIRTELSLRHLGEMQKYMWFAGSKHRATQVHFQVAMGREIVVADRMDLYLLWDNRRIFLKPIPRFLLDPNFWRSDLKCSGVCKCQNPGNSRDDGDTGWASPANLVTPTTNTRYLPEDQEQPPINYEQSTTSPGQLLTKQELLLCMDSPRKITLSFLYTYTYLISLEGDFFVANEKRLLPQNTDGSTIKWENWQRLVRELVKEYDPDKIHSRFLRAELRLSRINAISRFARLPPFDPYLRGWYNYSSLFRDNLARIDTHIMTIACPHG